MSYLESKHFLWKQDRASVEIFLRRGKGRWKHISPVFEQNEKKSVGSLGEFNNEMVIGT